MSSSFTIRPLLPRDYIEAFAVADLSFAAFNTLLYKTHPPSPSSLEKLTAARLRDIAMMPTARMFKAVDEDTGAIIGVARWIVTKEERVYTTLQEAVEHEVMRRVIPETNEAATRAFYTMATAGKWEVLGLRDNHGAVVGLVPRVELETLFTHPGYRGVGVASALVQWGVELADRLGMRVYFEAAGEGRPLYERFGFEVVRVGEFDAAEYGGVGRHVYTFMLRQPKTVRKGK
ncbi:GNAT family N-acetyltransferase [Aspergillus mulundensis]|uniref:N-acetyltransferase domain-containing protein n=1 Tax=Aspergillus mulundensis TaxID=1810919 RepID=A0A3D8QH25_9EURO|nr:Uncharacterized protein DSM5745_10644 [Aspergillus mulundensis]RDW61146.1 Uncharacterized protein DSM5745_10644 [Aspergillus mulundensis]